MLQFLLNISLYYFLLSSFCVDALLSGVNVCVCGVVRYYGCVYTTVVSYLMCCNTIICILGVALRTVVVISLMILVCICVMDQVGVMDAHLKKNNVKFIYIYISIYMRSRMAHTVSHMILYNFLCAWQKNSKI